MIFISYRRDDAPEEASSVAGVLRQQLGPSEVFFDKDDIPPGAKWPDTLEKALDEASVLVVVIGPEWLTAGKSEWGLRRIDDPEDWVRHEIERALSSQKTVIPVLVAGGRMPPPQAFPDDLSALPDHQWVDMGPENWLDGSRRLLDKIGTCGTDDDFPRGTSHAPPSFKDTLHRGDVVTKIELLVKRSPVVSVEGLSGAGKTYVVSDYVARSGRPAIWYEAQVSEPLEGLLTSLETEYDLGGGRSADRCKRLAQIMSRDNHVLIVDDFHAAERDSYAPLINAVLGRGGSATVIFIGRVFAEFCDLNAEIGHVEIGGLGEEELFEYLRQRDMDVDRSSVSRLHAVVGGLPFAASLFATLVDHFRIDPEELLSGDLVAEDRVAAWCERVLTSVEQRDRALLARLSVSDAPFDRSTLLALASVAQITDPIGCRDRLLRAYLLQNYPPDRRRVHPIVAKFSMASLSAGELKQTRIALAEHLLKNVPECPDAIYSVDQLLGKSRACRHFARAEDVDRALELAHDMSASAKAHGHYDLLLDVIGLLPDDVTADDPWLQYNVAHCLLITGRYADALAGAQAIVPGDDATLKVVAARLAAEALTSLGRDQEAMAALQPALAECSDEAVGNTAIRQAQSAHVWLLIRAQQFAAATECVEKLIAAAQADADQRGEAVALVYLGTIRRLTGEGESARLALETAIELFRGVPDRRGLSWSSGQLAMCLMPTDREAGVELAATAVSIAADICEAGPTYRELLMFLSAKELPSGLHQSVEGELLRLNQ